MEGQGSTAPRGIAGRGGRSSSFTTKRGRGGAGGPSTTFRSARGGINSSSNTSNSFKRKLAGTPLFQAQSADESDDYDNDSGADEAPSSSSGFNSKAGRPQISKMRDSSLYDSDAEAARKTRFETVASQNRYIELKPLREKERRDAIASGLIPDPLKPQRLDDAISFQGTCEDMCPEFEREEREYQKNVDKWELAPGTTRIDRNRAVKAFHRPAAGNEQPMPSDVRPPHILKMTLDYLFHDVLAQDPQMMDSHPFLRDRTRAIRQDFTLQNERGELAIECHERIARYHILCLHILREWENFSESQELEQLRKVLQSLNEFYDDARHEDLRCPHEAEFRAYYLITHLRDSDTIRQTELLPRELFDSQYIQSALRIQSLALRNNETRGERGRRPANSEASLNAFSRFFKAVASDQTSYLLACLAESHFVDIRRGALVAMKKAFIPQQPKYPVAKLAKMLGCDSVTHCAEVAAGFRLQVYKDARGVPEAVELHRGVQMIEYPPTMSQRASKTVVEAKRGNASLQSVIDGKFYSVHVDIRRAPTVRTKSTSVAPSLPPSKSPSPSLKTGRSSLSTTMKPLTTQQSPQSAFRPPPTTSAFAQQPGTAPARPGTTLNASASVFTPKLSGSSPPAPVKQPSPPSTKNAASVFPPQAHVKSASQVTPSTQPVQPAAAALRVPLSPRTTAPFTAPTQSSAPTKTQSTTSPSPKVVTSHVSAGSTHATSPVSRILPLLLDRLIEDFASSACQKAAIQGLSIVRTQQLAEREEEREQLIEACCSNLVDYAVEEVTSEYAKYAAVSHVERRRVLAQRLRRWKDKLATAREARKIVTDRRRRFSDLAHAINASPSRSAVQAEITNLELFDFARMELDDIAPVAIDAGRRKSTSSLLPPRRQDFWTPKTLYSLICTQIDKTFASYRSPARPDWKVLIVVSALDSPVTTWYRCKLGISPSDEGVISMQPHVRCQFTLTTVEEVHELDLADVGLVIVNLDGQEGWAGSEQQIQQHLAETSAYNAFKLMVDWTGRGASSDVLAIDTKDVNGGLALRLETALRVVRSNNLSRRRKSAAELVKPFVDVWRLSLQRCLAKAAMFDDPTIYSDLVGRFVSLLGKVNEQCESFVALEDEDDGALDFPPFDQSGAPSITSALASYLENAALQRLVPLCYLRLEVLQMADNPLGAIDVFFQYLSDALVQSYDSLVADHTLETSEIDQALTWYKEEVQDSAREWASLLHLEVGSLSGKKRRRASAALDTSVGVWESTAKRSKDAVSAVGVGDHASLSFETKSLQPWVPARVSSLTTLIEQTKALLKK